MKTHISKTVYECSDTLRRIRSIHALSPSWCCSHLSCLFIAPGLGLPMQNLDRLQSVHKSSVRMISARRDGHVSLLLRNLAASFVADWVSSCRSCLYSACLENRLSIFFCHWSAFVISCDCDICVVIVADVRSEDKFVLRRCHPWKNMPSSHRSLPSLLAFIRSLKTFILLTLTIDSDVCNGPVVLSRAKRHAEICWLSALFAAASVK